MADRREREKQKARRTNAKKVAEQQQGGFQPAWLKKLPNGVNMMRFKEEKVYKLDNIPFIAGKENPNADEGMEHFERTVYTHSGIGLDPRAHYLCPLMASKEGKAKKLRPCPICEHAQKLMTGGAPKEETDAFRPKKRQLFMFLDTRDREKGVQLHEGPYFFGLGQLIDRKMDALDEDSPKINWWTYDEGMTLHVSVKKESFKGQSYMKPVDLEIEPRSKQYDAKLLDKGCCLDELIKELPYDDLSEIFKQTGSADDEAEDKEEKSDRDDADGDSDETTSTNSDETTAEDRGIRNGSRVKHKKFGECDVVHVSKDGTSLKLEDDDGEVHSAVAPADCKLLDEEDDSGDEDEKPAKRRHVASKNTDVEDEDSDGDSDDEESDDDSDESEDEPEEEDDPPPAKGKKGGKAPPKKSDDDDEWDEDESDPEDPEDDDSLDEESDDDEPPVKSKKPTASKPPVKKGGKGR